jgi:hypothetical protein
MACTPASSPPPCHLPLLGTLRAQPSPSALQPCSREIGHAHASASCESPEAGGTSRHGRLDKGDAPSHIRRRQRSARTGAGCASAAPLETVTTPTSVVGLLGEGDNIVSVAVADAASPCAMAEEGRSAHRVQRGTEQTCCCLCSC